MQIHWNELNCIPKNWEFKLMINPPIQTMENIIIKITPLFSIFFCKDKTKPKIRQKSKGPQKSHSNNFESVDFKIK